MITAVMVYSAALYIDYRNHKRSKRIMSDITALTASVAGLTGIVSQLPPVLQANTDLGTRIIGVLESVLAQLKVAGPSQAEIDALTASVTGSLTSLSADVADVNATNAALQAEIAKATA